MNKSPMSWWLPLADVFVVVSAVRGGVIQISWQRRFLLAKLFRRSGREIDRKWGSEIQSIFNTHLSLMCVCWCVCCVCVHTHNSIRSVILCAIYSIFMRTIVGYTQNRFFLLFLCHSPARSHLIFIYSILWRTIFFNHQKRIGAQKNNNDDVKTPLKICIYRHRAYGCRNISKRMTHFYQSKPALLGVFLLLPPFRSPFLSRVDAKLWIYITQRVLLPVSLFSFYVLVRFRLRCMEWKSRMPSINKCWMNVFEMFMWMYVFIRWMNLTSWSVEIQIYSLKIYNECFFLLLLNVNRCRYTDTRTYEFFSLVFSCARSSVRFSIAPQAPTPHAHLHSYHCQFEFRLQLSHFLCWRCLTEQNKKPLHLFSFSNIFFCVFDAGVSA